METNATVPVIKALESTETISTVDGLQELREILSMSNRTTDHHKVEIKQSQLMHSGDFFWIYIIYKMIIEIEKSRIKM